MPEAVAAADIIMTALLVATREMVALAEVETVATLIMVELTTLENLELMEPEAVVAVALTTHTHKVMPAAEQAGPESFLFAGAINTKRKVKKL